MVKKGHANREAIGHLLENARLRPVSNARIDFQTPNHGPGMQYKRIFSGQSQTLRSELKLQNIFFGSQGRFVYALGLYPQHDNHLGAVKRFIDVRYAAHVWCERFQFARYPHRRTTQSDARAKFAQQMNIRSRHAAMKNVAKNGDVQSVELMFAIANRKSMEQRLRGVLV